MMATKFDVETVTIEIETQHGKYYFYGYINATIVSSNNLPY